MATIKKTKADKLETYLQMNMRELSEFFGIDRSSLHRIIYSGRSPKSEIGEQLNQMRMALYASIELRNAQANPPVIDVDIISESERKKQDHIIQLTAQISKQRHALDKMKSDFHLAQRTYHHLGDILDANTSLTEIQKMLLRSRQEDTLHVMRQSNTIQQQLLEAKILGMEREVEVLISAG
ncbi:MAG: hypothetical protein IPP69_14975 [Flavobacteriales bacterium]|nr:hypothetical protein [Flavobacteriales bacterium]